MSDEDMRGIIKSLAREEQDPDDVPKSSDPRCRCASFISNFSFPSFCYSKVKFLLLQFAQNSTTHGVAHMGEAHAVRVLLGWGLLLLAAAGAAGYLLFDTITQYLQYEVSVQISVRFARYFSRQFLSP